MTQTKRINNLTTVSPVPPTMRAMAIAGTGVGATLEQVQLPVPTPTADEVLVRVAYAGVNRADLLQMQGSYAPPAGASPILGLECSGHIAALGTQVEGWELGQPVCALLAGGAYAEYVSVSASQLLPIPENITLREAASLPEAVATAVMALTFTAHVKHGERVLLHGGASGVGIMLGQIAKADGAEVFATVGSDEKCAFVKNLGMQPINHHSQDVAQTVLEATAQEGVDVVIDILGAPWLETHFKLLRTGGRLVSLAMMEGNTIESLKLSRFFMKNLSWSAVTLRSRSPGQKAEIIAHVLKTVWPHIANGTIKPVIDSVFPLIQAKKALDRMQERLHLGKILLEVQAD